MPAWKLSEVHEILFENHLCEEDHRGEDDLAPEEERAICKYALDKFGSDFVFVTHFPSQHRAFYAMDDPEDPTLTLSFDLLMRGLEITSGGQRIHKEADYREKMLKRGMNPDNFRFYLDTFKNGMPPHGGFGDRLKQRVFTISLSVSRSPSLCIWSTFWLPSCWSAIRTSIAAPLCALPPSSPTAATWPSLCRRRC